MKKINWKKVNDICEIEFRIAFVFFLFVLIERIFEWFPVPLWGILVFWSVIAIFVIIGGWFS